VLEKASQLLFLTAITCLLLSPTEAKKPNVMIIMADDVGTGDVPGYWEDTSVVSMPNLEAVIQEGTTFTDAHSTPLCAASRYVLLSGNYQYRGELLGGSWTMNYQHGNQFRKGQQSLAQIFRDNGWHTSIFGKWHVGGLIPTVDDEELRTTDVEMLERMLSHPYHNWDRPVGQGPEDIGFEESYITSGGIQAPPYAFLRNNVFSEDVLSKIKFWMEGSYPAPFGTSMIQKQGEGVNDWDSTAYNMILVNETEAFIKNHLQTRPEDPFLTYVALGGVHTPHSPPDKYMNESPIAGEHANGHLDVLLEMDYVVGSLIQILKDNDVDKDTIIIFTSDNGGLTKRVFNKGNKHYSSGPLRGFKSSVYEGGHRVPLTIRWDNGNIPKGETRSNLVGLNDFYKTLCDLVGIDVPFGQAMDSISFADYLKDASATTGLRQEIGTWSKAMRKESIRVNNMKLIQSWQDGSLELYDLEKDISESNNLISTANQTDVDSLFNRLKAISPCYDHPKKKFRVKFSSGQIFKKGCGWVNKKKVVRCAKFPSAMRFCRFTCLTNSKDKQYCKVVRRIELDRPQ